MLSGAYSKSAALVKYVYLPFNKVQNKYAWCTHEFSFLYCIQSEGYWAAQNITS